MDDRAGRRRGPRAGARGLRTDFTVLIAPETSGILADLTRELENAGARLLGSTADAVELAADKAGLAVRLQELSIDTPSTRTIVPAAGLPRDATYPAVLKPVDAPDRLTPFTCRTPSVYRTVPVRCPCRYSSHSFRERR